MEPPPMSFDRKRVRRALSRLAGRIASTVAGVLYDLGFGPRLQPIPVRIRRRR
jgi:hypothetical protein